MKNYSRVARAALSQPWMIYPKSSQARAINEIMARRLAGNPLTDEEIEERLAAENGERDWIARLEPFGAIAVDGGALGRLGAQMVPMAAFRRAAASSSADRETYTAVLPIHGVLLPRVGAMERMSGATAVPDLHAAFESAVRDEAVEAIILDVDSPGGMVDQIPEFGATIFKARGSKPITAVADTMAASAAYWLASQADEVSASPSAVVGSVGAFMHHESWAKFWADMGVEHTLVTYGENKAGGNSFEPLGDHEREQMQSLVDYVGKQFDAAVAQGRAMSTADVREKFGQGDVFPAEPAKRIGMVDRIETLGETITRLGQTQTGSRSGSSALENTDGVETTDDNKRGVSFEVELARARADQRRRHRTS
ncbi:MAG TPA: S49 family peptidase [Candidatus Limnocylindrales bacterium]|nr:S49 family peptidase [Candidatus Limnocylindrales bacterium]